MRKISLSTQQLLCGEQITLCTGPGAALTLHPQAVAAMQDDLNTWMKLMREREQETWIWQRLKLPTFLVRFDAMVRGKFVDTCEIDDRPAGAFIAGQVNPGFKDLLASVSRQWPAFTGLVAPYRTVDIAEWVGNHTLEQVPSEGLLWVTARIGDPAYDAFGPRSVVPVRDMGNKSYLSHLQTGAGARVVSSGSQPDFSRRFVLKPLQGVCCNNVLVNWGDWMSGEGKEVRRPYRPKDAATRSQIEKALEIPGREWILQEYVPPPSLPDSLQEALLGASSQDEYQIPDDLTVLNRVYFGWYGGQFLPLGGIWMARSSRYCLIHGTRDAITGPVVLDDATEKKVRTTLKRPWGNGRRIVA